MFKLATIIVSLILGGISGWIASRIMKTRLSIGICILCGMVGSFVGGLAGSLLGLSLTILHIDLMGIILAIAGACLVIFIAGKLKR